MREERLLERIRTWEREPGRRGKEDTGRIVASILSHLQRILNTKQGNVPIAEDYGSPDFADFLNAFPDFVREIERAMRATIQKYEPRLKGVRVSFIPQDEDRLSLHFHIAARLATGPMPQVLFETVIGSEGKVSIKG